jgi:rhodanese-related sulfurtransferase
VAVPASITELAAARPGALTIIDIRKKPDEAQIPGSRRFDGEQLEHAVQLPFTKDEPVVLYCGSGNSCSRVAQTLREKGYANVRALDGGYAAWKEAGLPTEPITQTERIPER